MVYSDEQKDLFQQYKIMLIPTQVFLDASKAKKWTGTSAR
jgi:hypothetical protein